MLQNTGKEKSLFLTQAAVSRPLSSLLSSAIQGPPVCSVFWGTTSRPQPPNLQVLPLKGGRERRGCATSLKAEINQDTAFTLCVHFPFADSHGATDLDKVRKCGPQTKTLGPSVIRGEEREWIPGIRAQDKVSVLPKGQDLRGCSRSGFHLLP